MFFNVLFLNLYLELDFPIVIDPATEDDLAFNIAGHRCLKSEEEILQKIDLGLVLFQNYSNIHLYNVERCQYLN